MMSEAHPKSWRLGRAGSVMLIPGKSAGTGDYRERVNRPFFLELLFAPPPERSVPHMIREFIALAMCLVTSIGSSRANRVSWTIIAVRSESGVSVLRAPAPEFAKGVVRIRIGGTSRESRGTPSLWTTQMLLVES